MQNLILGFQLLYIFEGKHLNNHNLMKQIYNVCYYFIYSSFFVFKVVKKITLYIFFIDNEKGISHFKFAQLDYVK